MTAKFRIGTNVTRLREGESGVQPIDMQYPLIHQSGQRPYHFIHGYVQFLEQQLNLRIPVTRFQATSYLPSPKSSFPRPSRTSPSATDSVLASRSTRQSEQRPSSS